MENTEIPLKPIKIDSQDFEAIEKKIKQIFREEIYYPLLKELNLTRATIQNASYNFLMAIMNGRIQFSQGRFTGKFNATISKELKDLGAKWERRTASFKIPLNELPIDVRSAISASISKFEQKLKSIDKQLSQIVPEEIADKIKVSQHFESALWKVERDFQKSVKGITIAPTLSSAQKKRISIEWQNNMDIWIKDFTEKEVGALRTGIKKSVFAGNRYESAAKTIQRSYSVTENKAKFLARQETNLLMTKFKETRYQEAGVNEYKWGAVSGTPAHPVRPRHKALADASKAGKTFRWDDPPITSEPGQPERRNNPGEDYNCRCFAIPIVKFKKGK